MNKLKTVVGRAFAISRSYGAAMKNRGVIVAFHRVSNILPDDAVTKSARDFERFCRFFRANFDVITLDAFVDRLNRKQPLAGSLVITFDDGYLDNFEIAAPVLRALKLPATFFVTTEFVGSTVIPWWDQRLPVQPGWMNWAQVRQLAGDGFDIGAHTRTHADLGVVDGELARAEIAGSRQDLLKRLGRLPDHFAYPYGRPDNLLKANRQRVIEAGFRSCVSCHGRLVRAGEGPFTLHRVPISPWYRTPEQFGFEVLLGRA